MPLLRPIFEPAELLKLIYAYNVLVEESEADKSSRQSDNFNEDNIDKLFYLQKINYLIQGLPPNPDIDRWRNQEGHEGLKAHLEHYGIHHDSQPLKQTIEFAQAIRKYYPSEDSSKQTLYKAISERDKLFKGGSTLEEPRQSEPMKLDDARLTKEARQSYVTTNAAILTGYKRYIEETPIIKPVTGDRDGNFFIKFSKDAGKHQFYGEEITEYQAFRRYGNLPDNNILGNKLINVLGKNLLSLEKQADMVKFDKKMSVTRKEATAFTSALERESNAFHISLFEALLPLEQERSHDVANKYTDKDGTVQKRVGDLYQSRIKNINKQIDETADPIQQSRLTKLRTRIEENYKTTMVKVVTGSNLPKLYRKVMSDFGEEQRLISIYQHDPSRPLDYANQSLTEAYQDASYGMEKHVFSTHNPTDDQIWVAPKDKQDILIDSRQYSSMRKEDALYSACLIRDRGALPLEKAFKEQKKAIQDVSEKNRKEVVLTAKVERRTDEILKKRAALRAIKPVENAVQMLESCTRPPDKSPSIKGPDKGFIEGTHQLKGENPVPLHHHTDLWSAVGFAVTDFAKYLEGQNAAKHPNITAAIFVAMAATFGAAGLAAAGMHSMQGVSSAMAKLLTVNGKLGVSTAKFQSVVNSISNEWLELTFAKGSTFHALLLDGFALPQINYAVFDTMLNGSTHKDTLNQLTERLASQDLAVYTDAEKNQHMKETMMLIAGLLILSIGLGIGATVAAKGVGIAKLVGEFVSAGIEVPIETFTNLAASSVAGELVAIVALSLTLKSAGLFLGKMMLVINHMKGELSEIQQSSCHFMANLKEASDTGRLKKEEFDDMLKSRSFQAYRTHFEDVLEKNPKLQEIFGHEFLDKVGVTQPYISTPKRAWNYFASGAKTVFFEYIGKKTLLPLGQMVAGIFLAAVGMGTLWNWGENKKAKFFWNFDKNEKNTDPYGLKEAAWKLPMLVFNTVVMFSSLIKTATISVYGLAQRALMAASDALFAIPAIANVIFSNGWKGPFQALGAALGKIGLPVVSIVAEILNFVVGVVKYSLAAGAAVIGAAIGIAAAIVPGLLVGVFSLITGKDTFFKYMGGIKDAIKYAVNLPIHGGDGITKNIFKPFKSKIADAAYFIDKHVYEAEGFTKGANILAARDKSTRAIAAVCDGIKNFGGKVANFFRDNTIRRLEHLFQSFHDHGKDEHIAGEAAEAAKEVTEEFTMVRNPMHALGLMGHGASSDPGTLDNTDDEEVTEKFTMCHNPMHASDPVVDGLSKGTETLSTVGKDDEDEGESESERGRAGL